MLDIDLIEYLKERRDKYEKDGYVPTLELLIADLEVEKENEGI